MRTLRRQIALCIFLSKALHYLATFIRTGPYQDTRDTLVSRTGKGAPRASHCAMSVWWRTNVMHGFIIYQIKILFLYIFNQTNTKPSWELSAWRTFPPAVAACDLAHPWRCGNELADGDLLCHLLVEVVAVEHHGLQNGQGPLQDGDIYGRLVDKLAIWKPKGTQLITHGKQSREGANEVNRELI